MNTEKFEVMCFHNGEKLQVNCMRSIRLKAPEIYVHLRFKGRREAAFTFYEVNKNADRLFWFPHEGEKQELARGIAEALERKLLWKGNLPFMTTLPVDFSGK